MSLPANVNETLGQVCDIDDICRSIPSAQILVSGCPLEVYEVSRLHVQSLARISGLAFESSGQAIFGSAFKYRLKRNLPQTVG